MKKVIILSILSIFFGFSGANDAFATPIVLDFEGLANVEYVDDFYNGGGGTNYGIEFSSNALAIIDKDAGGSGNFGGEPSPDTILFFLQGDAAIMNLSSGFDTGFSFYYAGYEGGFVDVYDEVGGTGNVLASFSLPGTEIEGAAADPTGAYGPFEAIGVSFDGIAKSVAFGGVANQIGFDNITFGSSTPGTGSSPVPEPATMLLLGSGLLGSGALARRRRKQG